MKADAVVLAAGLSRRMGRHNKLLLRDTGGRTMVEQVVRNLRAAGMRDVVAVLGHQAPAVAAALARCGARMVVNPDYGNGQATSLRVGLAALAGDADAVLVALGDMPLVRPHTVEALLEAFVPGSIVAPMFGPNRGNPVLWDAAFIPKMLALAGDTGARSLLQCHTARLLLPQVADPGVLQDADTLEAAAALGYGVEEGQGLRPRTPTGGSA